KAAAGDSAISVISTAMRVCGGAVFWNDLNIERLFRDANDFAGIAQTGDVMRGFIGKSLLVISSFCTRWVSPFLVRFVREKCGIFKRLEVALDKTVGAYEQDNLAGSSCLQSESSCDLGRDAALFSRRSASSG